jgi:hypothetical protein
MNRYLRIHCFTQITTHRDSQPHTHTQIHHYSRGG